MAFALPGAAFWGLGELLSWLGLGLAVVGTGAVVSGLLARSQVSAKMRQYATDSAAAIEADLKRQEDREETPFTHGHLFENGETRLRGL